MQTTSSALIQINDCVSPPTSETQNIISNFIPNSNSPTLVFKVNFIFPYDPTQINIFYGASMPTLYSGCALTISNLNTYFNTLGNNACWLPVLNPSPLVPNPKIQFVLNNVYKPASALANDLAFWYDNAERDSITYQSDNAITVIFCPYTNSTNLTGGADVPGLGFIRYHYLAAGNTYTGNDLGGQLLAHEMGHAIGRLPDQYNLTNTVIPSSMPPPYDPVFSPLPTHGAYFADDSPKDILAYYSCYNPLDPTNIFSNNNLMGNSFCREHLSAKQIASFHYLVAAGITSKYLQNSNMVYPPLHPNAISTILIGNQTITNDILFKKIIIQSGSTITVQNANILATDLDSKIIIEPGAILRLINVKVGSYLDLKWNGIEVWGNPYLPQTNSNQGALVLLNSCISNAEKGVLVGKTDNNGLLTGIHGGGIVESISSNFFNNINHVTFDFLSGVSVAASNNQNRSLFRQTTFKSYKQIYEQKSSITFIELNNTRRLRFLSCQFDLVGSNPNNISIIGIKGNNSSVEIQPYAGTAPSIYAFSFDHFVYLTNCFGNNLIQDNTISSQKGIYISNGNYDKIVRNEFNIADHPYNGTTNPRSAIYLDNCKNYKVENNKIYSYQKSNSFGIVVNNSGPYPNKIYNNEVLETFFGIWCQNQNYDPNSTNFDGLVLNCNDFSNVNYNVGIMEFSGFNNTGIAKFQGDPTDPDKGSRNTYNSPSCGDENKFYVYAPISNPPQMQHHNYQGSPFGISPQPACSNVNEIIDITGIPAPPLKSLYCTNTSTLPGSRTFHTDQITQLINLNNSLESTYNSNLDNGNTQSLLSLINSNTSPGQIKNHLMAAPYLSDTVLLSYFNKANTPAGHAKQVHEKNAPVSSKIWQTIINQNYPNGIFNQMQSKQNSFTTCTKDLIIGRKSSIKNNLNYEIMHKSMSVLNDSTLNLTNKQDSLSKLIQISPTKNQSRQLIELDIYLGLFGQAREKVLNYINNAENLTDLKYGDFMFSYINILNNPEKMHNFNSTQAEYEIINNAAQTDDHPCNIVAKGLLSSYNQMACNQLYLTPIINTRGRLINNKIENKKATINEQTDLVLFPNPANTKLYLRTMNATYIKLLIYNVTGQAVCNKTLSENELMETDVTHLPNGIYLVTLLNKNNELIKSQKLIIEH